MDGGRDRLAARIEERNGRQRHEDDRHQAENRQRAAALQALMA